MKPNVRYELVADDDNAEERREEIEMMEEQQMPAVRFPTTLPVRTTLNQSVILTAVALISCYFILSISLTFYQRWLLKDFHYPLSVVLFHLVIKLFISYVIRVCYKLYTGKSRILLDWRTSVKKILPTGFASGIDIGFSNWGLELVNISLYTMTKSTTIVFILIFAILLRLEKKSWSLLIIVVMISSGLCLFTYKSTDFDLLGFVFLLFASFSSGIRWSFAQLIMQKSKIGLHNPVDMVFHMQPWMILAIIPFTLGFEGSRVLEHVSQFHEMGQLQVLLLFSKLSVGAVVAFAMEISEFLVLSYTSSLTLSVAGIFKEICQLVLAVEINGDQLSVLNVLGLIMCVGGICSHVIHKYWMYLEDQASTPSPDDSVEFEKEPTSPSNRNTASRAINGGKYHHQKQKMPLLDSDDLNPSDSDNSQHDDKNSSEVLFDILKRRDARR